jgi:predicted porin
MKKKIMSGLGCAIAALCAASPSAHAQGSVTLYGLIDEGFSLYTNVAGQHQYLLNGGVMQGSRWGLRGSEDLGGGLKAVFRLENGFDPSTGKLSQGGLGFGRQAYVGLESPYGTVTLGRQYDSVVDYMGPLEVGDQWGGYIAAHPGDVDNFNNQFRTNNAIKYTSQSLGGFTFGGLYSLGGVAGDFTKNQVWSFGGQYANGPLVLAAAYLNVRNPNVGFFGNSTSGTINPNVSNLPSPIYNGYGSAHTYQVIGAGGAYTFGAATVGGTYSNIKFYNLGASYPSSFRSQTATFNNVELNFKYQITSALLAGIAYDYLRGSSLNGFSAAKYQQGSAGVDYFLSKRTDVYIIGVVQHASGYAANPAGTAVVPAVAAINGLTGSSNSNQFTARVGIRHKF